MQPRSMRATVRPLGSCEPKGETNVRTLKRTLPTSNQTNQLVQCYTRAKRPTKGNSGMAKGTLSGKGTRNGPAGNEHSGDHIPRSRGSLERVKLAKHESGMGVGTRPRPLPLLQSMRKDSHRNQSPREEQRKTTQATNLQKQRTRQAAGSAHESDSKTDVSRSHTPRRRVCQTGQKRYSER